MEPSGRYARALCNARRQARHDPRGQPSCPPYGARIEARKALDVLIGAVALMERHVQLVLAGPDCGVARELQHLATKLGVQNRVRFSGENPGQGGTGPKSIIGRIPCLEQKILF